MTSYGIDGLALDMEGDTYSVLHASAPARAAFVQFLTLLKARMHEAVPGAQLTVWCTTTGGPWNDLFTHEQIVASVAAVDHFLVMAYSLGVRSMRCVHAPHAFIRLLRCVLT
jgi:hypothetical protein